MKKIIISLILLCLVLTCNAQEGNINTGEEITFGYDISNLLTYELNPEHFYVIYATTRKDLIGETEQWLTPEMDIVLTVCFEDLCREYETLKDIP